MRKNETWLFCLCATGMLLSGLLIAVLAFLLLVSASGVQPEPTETAALEQESWSETVMPPEKPAAIPVAETKKVCFALTSSERDLVERLVQAEAGNQSEEGMMAVAQCVLETAKAQAKNVKDVINAPKQYADPADADEVTEDAREAVRAVFDEGETVLPSGTMFFYSTAGGFVSRWHETHLRYVTTIGDHRFFKI